MARASKKDAAPPPTPTSTMVRLDAFTIARIDRVLEEFNRKAREGEDGIPSPQITRTALHRALIEPGLQEYERRLRLPKLDEAEFDAAAAETKRDR